MDTRKVDRSAIVAKDNSLVGLLAKFELSELRLLAFCLAHYDSRTSDNREITARVSDLKAIFNMVTKDAYAVVRRAVIGINKKPYEHFDEDDCWVCDFWFSQFKYRSKKGVFIFKISPEMMPHLLTLKGSFTQYRLADVYQFRRASTWKLYENIAQWRTARRWSVKLDELRARLGVAGKYPDWYPFNRELIKPAVSEINTLSDLQVEYHLEKQGRRVVGLVFQIEIKGDKDTITLEPPEDELNRRLLDAGINAKTAGKYAREINHQGAADRILAKLPGIVERAKQCGGTSTPKYVIGSIRSELKQQSLLDIVTESGTTPPNPEYKPSLDCWHDHRQRKEPCPIRSTSDSTPNKEMCRVCLTKIPVDLFGI